MTMGYLEELLPIFRDESAEALDKLDLHLERLAAESGQTWKDVLRDSMRITHTIKGGAAIVGIVDLSALAHRMEDALVPFRTTDGPIPGELRELLQRAVLCSRRLSQGEFCVEETAAVMTSLEEWTARPVPVSSPAEGLLAPQSRGRKPKRPKGSPQGERGASPAAGEPVVSAPGRAPSAEAPPEALTAAATSVRVEAARLDRLMVQAGEMLIARGRAEARARNLHSWVNAFADRRRLLARDVQAELAPLAVRLEDLVAEDDREVRELVLLTERVSTSIRQLRMLPLASLAGFWRRTVQEAAIETSRQVDLVTDVGDLELDKEILEGLREPFLHLLRNAVDHGIEPPEVRAEKGKPARGQITVRAEAAGELVRVSVSDDGRGIDPAAIGAAAVERGLATVERVAAMSEEEQLLLLFASGFSTRKTLSRLSGRGVGLDVVASRLAELGGQVSIRRGEAGVGARFDLLLPVSLLSLHGLLVKAGGVVCALPIDLVEPSLRVESTQLAPVDDGLALLRPGAEPLRVRSLASLLGRPWTRPSGPVTIAIVARGGSRMGLVVDEVLGEQEFVTRRLPWNLRAVPGVASAFILPDGAVALVLDGGHLLSARPETTSVSAVEPAKGRRQRILVVDDSLTVRTLTRGILSRAGYDVVVAADGQEAWEQLEKGPFDLLVSDIEMPRLDGLELTRRVRATSALKTLPVILVTTRGDAHQVQAGAEAGADEYVLKGTFEQQKLLDAVSRHL